MVGNGVGIAGRKPLEQVPSLLRIKLPAASQGPRFELTPTLLCRRSPNFSSYEPRASRQPLQISQFKASRNCLPPSRSNHRPCAKMTRSVSSRTRSRSASRFCLRLKSRAARTWYGVVPLVAPASCIAIRVNGGKSGRFHVVDEIGQQQGSAGAMEKPGFAETAAAFDNALLNFVYPVLRFTPAKVAINAHTGALDLPTVPQSGYGPSGRFRYYPLPILNELPVADGRSYQMAHWPEAFDCFGKRRRVPGGRMQKQVARLQAHDRHAHRQL